MTLSRPGNLIVVFYLKRLTKYNIRTFNIPANCQISYRLLKYKGLKSTFLFGLCAHTRFQDIVLATGRWFSPTPPVSSTNKTDRHDITEILLKVVVCVP
jgi:hypothetical protein